MTYPSQGLDIPVSALQLASTKQPTVRTALTIVTKKQLVLIPKTDTSVSATTDGRATAPSVKWLTNARPTETHVQVQHLPISLVKLFPSESFECINTNTGSECVVSSTLFCLWSDHGAVDIFYEFVNYICTVCRANHRLTHCGYWETKFSVAQNCSSGEQLW